MAGEVRTTPPFRAEHIGSLLRPAELIQAHGDCASGKISASDFRSVQDQCIGEVVRLQEEIGLESITDGEFRRGSYFSHFIESLEGMTDREALFVFHNASGETFEFRAPHVSGKLRRRRGISTEEFRFLAGVTQKTPKLTMPSPSTLHFFRGRKGVDELAYPEEEEFFEDLVRIYREELAQLRDLGARYIQVDEVPLAMLCDPNIREAVRTRREDPEWLLEKYIHLLNRILQGKPQDLTVGLHLCRGNYKAKWLSEGGYLPVAERLFSEVIVDAFFLEYDTPRAGDFGPLQYLPSDKMVVLGLISSKTPALEPVEVLQKRVDEACRYVPLERLAISPQCGFATSVGSRPMTPEDQIRKLELVVNAARQIWR